MKNCFPIEIKMASARKRGKIWRIDIYAVENGLIPASG